MRTVDWDYTNDKLRLIDQRLLPGEFRLIEYDDYQKVIDAIRMMVVRGAPAIGATAAFGLALAGFQSNTNSMDAFIEYIHDAAEKLSASRPTAVNLTWAIHKLMHFILSNKQLPVSVLRQLILEEAQRLADEDVKTNIQMARNGAELINDGDTIIHHCNTGALATVDWGTALGVIRMAHDQGKKIHVLVDETRPRLQGSRLTAWELSQYGIPYDIISDNAAGFFLSTGQVQKVFFGGDRVAANGDVANKIGSYMLSLAAHDNQIPVYVVVPLSTIDISLSNGDQIPIEVRNMDEVLNLQINGERVSPIGATARNPSFDITPHRLLSGIVTEKGIIHPPFSLGIIKIMNG